MTMQEAFADSIKGSIKQNIGNYNMEMKTDPSNPIAGQNAKILLRIGSINGDDLVDLPILIRISFDGHNLTKTNPILVPYGHYVYNYVFAKSGTYALNVDINNDYYSGQNITFTFPINVNGPFLFFPYVNSPLSTGLMATGIIIIITIAVITIVIYAAIHFSRRQKNLQRTKI
jgi:heme/copper-type cytochrome/quinol oxidase subunit 2